MSFKVALTALLCWPSHPSHFVFHQEQHQDFSVSPMEACICTAALQCSACNHCKWLTAVSAIVQEQQIGAEEYEALCKGTRNPAPPPITDELSRWVNETQWSALQPLTQLPVSVGHAAIELLGVTLLFLFASVLTNIGPQSTDISHTQQCRLLRHGP